MMRTLSAAIVAALFAVGNVSAYAQAPAPAAPAKTAKPKACSKRTTEAECTAPDCSWTPPAAGKKKGKCATAKKS